MKTIVTLCGTGWAQWPSLVRTRALDLYHVDEGVEFWDAANPPTNDQPIWGNWPRHATLGGPALMAEFEEQISKLGQRDRLALFMVYPSPATLLADTPPRIEYGGRLPSRDDLVGLYNRSLARNPTLAQRVLRTVVFDRHDEPEAVRAVQALIGQRVFDSAFFLTDNHGGNRSEILRRRFYGLRVLIDMARDGHDSGDGRDFWPDLLRPGPGKLSPVYVLRMPADPPSPDPSIRRCVEIAAYFDRQTHERGQDSVGQSLKDLQALRQQIDDKITEAKGLLPAPSPLRTSRDDNERIEARPQGLLRERLVIADSEPNRPNEAEVDRWRKSILDNLVVFFNGRRRMIRDQQASTDTNSRRAEADINATMRSAISAHQTGLTSNAHNKVVDILKDVRDARTELANACTVTRDEIFSFIALETRDGDEARHANGDRVRGMAEFAALVAMHQEFRVTTANTVRWRRYAMGMIAPFSMIYLLLMAQAYAQADNPTLLSVLALGPSLIKLGLVAAGYLMAFGLAAFTYRGSCAEWRRQRDDIIEKSEQIARRLAAVADASARYGKLATEMSWLSLIEQKLVDLASEINEPLILRTVNALRPTGADAPLTAEEERAFNNALAGRLSQTPVNQWIQVMLDRPSPEPVGRIELTFGDDRSGSLAVSSRLGIQEPVVVTRAAA